LLNRKKGMEALRGLGAWAYLGGIPKGVKVAVSNIRQKEISAIS
jgi:hypothetical protein